MVARLSWRCRLPALSNNQTLRLRTLRMKNQTWAGKVLSQGRMRLLWAFVRHRAVPQTGQWVPSKRHPRIQGELKLNPLRNLGKLPEPMGALVRFEPGAQGICVE